MREDLTHDLLPQHGEPIDPVELARRDLRKTLPKRFYQKAHLGEADGLHTLLLDGKPAHTPGRKRLAVANQAVAAFLAAEWQAQEDLINPGTMPVTRLVNSALDGVALNMDAVQAEIVKYAASDLVCYRAGEPEALVRAQNEAWAPVLAFARDRLSARFQLAEGVMFVAQDASAIDAVRAAVEQINDPIKLAALSTITTLTGSALIALSVWHRALDLETAWSAAHVDEDFQARLWGEDFEAAARRKRRWSEMLAAGQVLLAGDDATA